jgi:hypothetical protein
VAEEQREEISDVVEMQMGVDDRVDVRGAKTPVHETLETSRPTVEKNALPAGGLEQMTGGTPLRMEVDGSRTQDCEAHRRSVAGVRLTSLASGLIGSARRLPRCSAKNTHRVPE